MLSMIFSAFMAVNGCYRYFYWLGIKGISLDQLAAEVSLLGLFAIHIGPQSPVVDNGNGEVYIEMTEQDDNNDYAVIAVDELGADL